MLSQSDSTNLGELIAGALGVPDEAGNHPAELQDETIAFTVRLLLCKPRTRLFVQVTHCVQYETRQIFNLSCTVVYVKAGVEDYVKTVDEVQSICPTLFDQIIENEAKQASKFAHCVILDPPYNLLDQPWDMMDPRTAALFLQMSTACLVPGGIVWCFQQMRVRGAAQSLSRFSSLTRAFAGYAIVDVEPQQRRHQLELIPRGQCCKWPSKEEGG